MEKMENFLNKTKGTVKKSLLFSALISGLAPNQKIGAQSVIDNFSKNEINKIELTDSAQEDGKILNLIEKFENKIKDQTKGIFDTDKKVFSIIAEKDLKGETSLNEDFMPEKFIAEEIAVDFVNNKENESKFLLGRSLSDLRAIKEEIKLQEEGFIDVSTPSAERKYVQPDYYIVIKKTVNDSTGKLTAKFFSLNKKEAIGEVNLEYKVLDWKENDQKTDETLKEFNVLVQEEISQIK